MLFTVIICTFNRANLLATCLASLRDANNPSCGWEILVVDNNSEDETPRIVEKFRRDMPALRYERVLERNLSVARNHGCARALGAYLAYLDDDAKIPPEYLCRLEECLTANTPDLMGGPVYPYYSASKPPWFRDSYETKKFSEVSGFFRRTRLTGANFIIRRDVLEKVGCFDPAHGMKDGKLGLGEERKVLDTYRRLTPETLQKIYYSLECPVFHHVDERKLRFHYFLHRSYLSAFTNAMIRFELGLPYPSPAGFLKEFLWLPRNFLTALFSEYRKGDPARRDYALATSRSAAKLGNLAATLLIFFRRARGIKPGEIARTPSRGAEGKITGNV